MANEMQKIVNEHGRESQEKDAEIRRLKKEIEYITEVFHNDLKDVEYERDKLREKLKNDTGEIEKLTEMVMAAEKKRDELEQVIAKNDYAQELLTTQQTLRNTNAENERLKN